ncbi:uncharacterized protein LOC135461536 isoform X2 [Liolophura sinensis]|uniref:uncharacterized protein LOC135461536 isoform X2 n=1 Tax=Liolophura sinensis TaxID=3198878 RepID=UPI00315903C2
MATAYHQEALRKQRILERKKEAAIRMEAERQGIFEPGPALPAHSLNPPVQTDTYGTNSYKGMIPIQAFHRNVRSLNQHTDQVYPILHPREHNFRVPVNELPERKTHFKV